MRGSGDAGRQAYVILKTATLVTVPPTDVVTLIRPVVAPAGTLVRMFVAVSFVMMAAVPLKSTAVPFDNSVPVIATFLLTLPLRGLTIGVAIEACSGEDNLRRRWMWREALGA